jgi:hypothetical protein
MIESTRSPLFPYRSRIAMKPEPLFYIEREGRVVAGPYDLVQMAGLLRKKIITPETPTRLEGEDGWKLFSWQPQFMIAKEMSPDAVSARVDELDEERADASRPPIPLPSTETLMKLGGLVFGAFLAGAGAYFIARVDITTGYCLEAAGGAAVIVAVCMIIARLLDEDFWTLLFVFFVPLGDIFYFISNIWEYYTWFCVKYVGAAVCAGAAMGMAAHQ